MITRIASARERTRSAFKPDQVKAGDGHRWHVNNELSWMLVQRAAGMGASLHAVGWAGSDGAGWERATCSVTKLSEGCDDATERRHGAVRSGTRSISERSAPF